jgi:hypothetical protein
MEITQRSISGIKGAICLGSSISLLMMPVQTSKITGMKGMNNFKTIIPDFTRLKELEARHQPPSPVSARHISHAKPLISALFNAYKFALDLKEEMVNPSPKRDLTTTAPLMNRKIDAITVAWNCGE